MPTVTTSSKGQIVIPSKIRKELGIKAGTKVSIVSDHQKITLYPLPKDPIRAARGLLKGGPSLTEELLKDRREEIESDKKLYSR